MRKNYDIRLAALREYLKSLSADETTFIVEGSGEFHTSEDPFPTCWNTAHTPMTGGALFFIRTRLRE